VYVLLYMFVTFPTCQVERLPLKAAACSNTAHSNKEKSKNRNGIGKKKEERALFKNRMSAATERRREIEAAKKDPILERGGKSVRTVLHDRHFPDLPGGEITIKGTSILKHCTTQQQRKVQG
jgi:hypothetical protein